MTRLDGRCLKLCIRGTSHAERISFRLDGLPADFTADDVPLAAFLERRAPGRDTLSTARRESDRIHWTVPGQAGYILNENVRPGDYDAERTIPRPGHADYPQYVRHGRIPTGGGANSGRMTAAYCAAGGLCLQYLERRGISVSAKIVACGDIANAKRAGDSVGGVIECEAKGVPPGIGGAMFDGLDGDLSRALFGIPGVKGVEFGNGFAACDLKGSENNDAFTVRNGVVCTRTNRHGGILGGFSSGMPIVFRVAMKPTPTIFKEQESVDLATMKSAKLTMKGRHDPCIVRRAVPVVEAMAAFVLADRILADESAHPRICLTLTGKTLEEDLAQYASQKPFVDVVELRVDLLDRAERARAATFPAQIPVPVILTFRRVREGGAYGGSERTRVRFFRQALTAGRFAYVDFEDDFRIPALAALAQKRHVRIIRSRHDFTGKPGNVAECCRRLRGGTDEIPKVAFKPKDLREVVETFDDTHSFRSIPHIVCAMGPLGLATRVLACRTGSMLTYVSVAGLEGIGHVTPREMVDIYRFREQTPDFALYGVTGWPLKVTRSPEINNRAWRDADEDRIMIPFPADDAYNAFAFMWKMDMRGVAVTMPHKREIMQYMGALDAGAQKVGAVNTIVIQSDRGETIAGYNTDVAGFDEAIRRFVGREDFAGLKIAVLGAGGASKAVVFALKKRHAQVRVFHRATPSPHVDLIVNATPVDPIPDYVFTGHELVYDLVYEPEVTPLMARAQAAGCRVENGFSMLVAQAAAQRRLWSEA